MHRGGSDKNKALLGLLQFYITKCRRIVFRRWAYSHQCGLAFDPAKAVQELRPEKAAILHGMHFKRGSGALHGLAPVHGRGCRSRHTAQDVAEQKGSNIRIVDVASVRSCRREVLVRSLKFCLLHDSSPKRWGQVLRVVGTGRLGVDRTRRS